MTTLIFPGELEEFGSQVFAASIPIATIVAMGMSQADAESLCCGEPNGSLAALCDIEVHEALGAMSPSDWNGNPATNEGITVFAQDGTGSMIGFWRRDPGDVADDCPVVFLGSEGMTAVLAPNLAVFAFLLACGNHTYEWAVALQDPAGENGWMLSRAKPLRYDVIQSELAAVFAPEIDASLAEAAVAASKELTVEFGKWLATYATT
ncbi:MAG: hypothetical protein Q8Q09_07100 [Deltaproteobacteria bacterium]|nr:hypothetical protein [Deltaproteobacteria bacterium]